MLGKVKDGSGVDIIGLLVNGMRNSKDGKAFVPTMFARPGQQTPVPKLQYIVKVDGWNWMVGSGLYTDDVDVMLRQALWSSWWPSRCAAWRSAAPKPPRRSSR